MRELLNCLHVRFIALKIGLFLLFFHIIGAQAQGLMFNSNDSLLNKRTSYDVFSIHPQLFQDRLSINFDLSLWDNKNLGYIFNLTGKNNSYSLSYLYFNGAAYLNFNIDRKSNKLKIPIQTSQLHKRKWIKVKVDFDLKADNVKIYIDNQLYQASGLWLEDTITAKLIFGKNQYYMEVPDMAIKNLVVEDSQKSFTFPLDESVGNIVHNNNGEEIGLVDNPVWLINDSYYWKLNYEHTFKQVAGLNFTTVGQKLFIYTRDSLIVYDSEKSNAVSTAFKKRAPVAMLLGKSIFNAREDKCYIYEAFNVPPGTPSIASLDMKSMTWEAIGKAQFIGQRHHHNIFYNKTQDSLYLFGGYGLYTYYNNFFKYNRNNDKWQKTIFKGDTITPRFFSAVSNVNDNNEVYLFGGYGNESGSQVVGGRQYYDLYCINLKTHIIKKIWNIHPNEVFVPANNLVLSSDGKYFYALCYPHEIFKTNIKLYKFSIKDGSYQIVSAPIPVVSERIESDINLFLNNKTNQLLCTIQEFIDPNNSIIKIYSLSYPPVSAASYSQFHKWQIKHWFKLIYIVPLLAAILLIFVLIWLYKKKIRRNIIPVIDEFEDELPDRKKIDERKINAVYLLGEFMVFDKKGRDVTYLFSPKIKKLFILILLYSKENNGISSKKISQLLWPDKDVAKTKNIKGVTFNHLRSAMCDIDGIELTLLNDIYFFSTDEAFYCDYYIVLEIFKKGSEGQQTIDNYLQMINRGSFLSSMTDMWLDGFKSDFEELLLNQLLPLLDKLHAEENYKQLLEISRLILNVDVFNDTALKYQLKSYRRIKGIDYTKKIYEQFVTEYKKSLGVDYAVSLDKILH